MGLLKVMHLIINLMGCGNLYNTAPNGTRIYLSKSICVLDMRCTALEREWGNVVKIYVQYV